MPFSSPPCFEWYTRKSLHHLHLHWGFEGTAWWWSASHWHQSACRSTRNSPVVVTSEDQRQVTYFRPDDRSRGRTTAVENSVSADHRLRRLWSTREDEWLDDRFISVVIILTILIVSLSFDTKDQTQRDQQVNRSPAHSLSRPRRDRIK